MKVGEKVEVLDRQDKECFAKVLEINKDTIKLEMEDGTVEELSNWESCDDIEMPDQLYTYYGNKAMINIQVSENECHSRQVTAEYLEKALQHYSDYLRDNK